MKKVIIGLLLFLSCSAAHAEYALINQVVYWLNDKHSTAFIQNFVTTGGTITVPPYVTYQGVKYEVVGIAKYDFKTSTRNTYNVSSALFGDGLLTDLATLDAAERERAERPFRYDYDAIRPTITALNLPNTLLTISKGAFDGMKSLKSLVIPASVKYLPDDGFLSSNHIFKSYLPNLKSITILGLPEFETYVNDKKCTIALTSQDENGNPNYVEHIKEKFDLSYCRNLVSFSMPEYEKRTPTIKAFYKANKDLETETRQYNSNLNKVLAEAGLNIPVPALKDEACVNVQTVQEAYNQAHLYLESMFKNCNAYAMLYDSLMNQLKQHPYYDGSVLPTKIPVLDPQEPQISTIAALSKTNREELITEYRELTNEDMERNLRFNHPDKYIVGHISVHPEKKEVVEKLFLDYRCEDTQTQYIFIIAYLEDGRIERTCRQSLWNSNRQLFDSQEEFDLSYDKARSDKDFKRELSRREDSFQRLSDLKYYVPIHIKKIKLSNIDKKPNEETVKVLAILNTLKRTYFYDRAATYLIETFPKVAKEYEKNGQHFKSKVEFFDAYTSDSYSSILKGKKKK